jgi:hypothetical protein
MLSCTDPAQPGTSHRFSVVTSSTSWTWPEVWPSLAPRSSCSWQVDWTTQDVDALTGPVALAELRPPSLGSAKSGFGFFDIAP